MNEKFTVNYHSFENASGDVNVLHSSLEKAKGVISTSKSIIYKDDVFMGPVADSCKDALEKLDSRIQFSLENFDSMIAYFDEVAKAYEDSDDKAGKLILSKSEDGKLSTVTQATVDSKDEKSIFDCLVSELQKNGMNLASAQVAACAMMGNAYRETGHTFDATLTSPSGTSHGIFQWRNGAASNDKRWDEVVAWCSANGHDANTLEGQLAYVAYDVTKGRYTDVGGHFSGAANSEAGVTEQTELFLRKYEGAKREDVNRLYPDVDYDARYLNPSVNQALEYYRRYVLGAN